MTAIRRHWPLVSGMVATVAVLAAAAAAAFAGGDVRWGGGDFLLIGGGMLGLALGLDRLWCRGGPIGGRLGGMLGVATAVLLLFAQLAVGVVRAEGHPANLLVLPVVACGVVGGMLAPRRAAASAWLLGAAAVAQLSVPFAAIAFWSLPFDAGLARSLAAGAAAAAAFATAAVLVWRGRGATR